MRYSPLLLVVSCATACGEPAKVPTTVELIPKVTVALPFLRDQECGTIERTLSDVEKACPAEAYSRASLQRPDLHAELERCASSIDTATARLRDPSVIDAAKYAAWATRVIGSKEVERASLDAYPEGSSTGVDPAFVLVLAQRAHAFLGLRAWCSTEPPHHQPPEWDAQTKPVLLSLQPAFSKCTADARALRATRPGAPLELLPGHEMTMNWRTTLDADGKPHDTAQIDFPSTMPADIALCVLGVVNATTFPKPNQSVVLGSNVTFANR